MSTSLQRFLDAQAGKTMYPAYEFVINEMRHGNKKTHWIWYIFPQLRGISLSINSMKYGIANRAEAEAYIMHPILGPRLTEMTQIILSHLTQSQRKLHTVMNTTIDAKKFMRCMTLFTEVAPHVYNISSPWIGEFLDAANQIIAIARKQGYKRSYTTLKMLGMRK
jgi:uncharacterized protein (DUF1810 family)